MKKKEMSMISLFLMGGALFAMHFGASSMIWPMTWGKESGSNVLIAYVGVFLTALLLPLLAYVALSRGKGTFLSVTTRAMPKFGQFFCGATIMILGPLYVIPRMSAASWDAIVQITGLKVDSIIPIVLFSCVYYLLTYWFVSSRSQMVDKISNILFPVLVLIVVGVIVKGLVTPISTWVEQSYDKPAFIYGFTEGYATGDLLCGLVFGIIILNNLKEKGVSENNLNNMVIKVGIVGIGMLCLTHLGHMLVGSFVGDTLDLQYASLYTQVVLLLWGKMGGIFFSIALIFASLTTAIGLTAATAEYFEEATKGKLPYKKGTFLVLLGSTVIGSIGLDSIVAFFAPLLDAFYPGAIVITLYYSFMPDCMNPKKLNAMRFGVIVSFFAGMLDVLYTYNSLFGLNIQVYNDFYTMIPLTAYKLSWVPIALIFMCIGYFTCRTERTEKTMVLDMVNVSIEDN